MSLAEWSDWISFHRVEPFGDQVEDERLRLLASWICGAITRERLSPKDFDFTWGEPEKVFVSLHEGLALLKQRI